VASEYNLIVTSLAAGMLARAGITPSPDIKALASLSSDRRRRRAGSTPGALDARQSVIRD
jgi:hypothetical protein